MSRIQSLQKWYRAKSRDLPWRKDTDLYSIWLSEIMLQQTQVVTVIPYFLKFKERFPTVQHLARASIDEVYSLWAGLGYYSRARNLHRGAQALAARLDAGRGLPSTRDEWLEIPGVGPYTAGAICSIGLNQREPIVDGNVVRVISRWERIAKLDPKLKVIWHHARALVEARGVEPRVFNQALMELGATVCRPKNPVCGECPVAVDCRGRTQWESYPPKKVKPETKKVVEKRWIVLRVKDGLVEVCLEQTQTRASSGKRQWREGLWDFQATPPKSSGRLKIKWIGEFWSRYVVTVHKVQRLHQVVEVVGGSKSGSWFRLDQLPGVPAPVKKALKQIVASNDKTKPETVSLSIDPTVAEPRSVASKLNPGPTVRSSVLQRTSSPASRQR